jgi:formylglycine-generating enzyme required for sulfatase activity
MAHRRLRASVVVLVTASIAIACGSFSAEDPVVPPAEAGPPAANAPDAAPDAAPADAPSDTTTAPACPSGRGPSMLPIVRPAGAGTFCIDATEVTQAQYKAFLDATDKPAKSGCKAGFDPLCDFGAPTDFAPASRGAYPVACVDWCDAVSFCAWAGKRLCGDLSGVDAGADRDDRSEWFGACSAFAQRAYPWGAEVERGLGGCNLASTAAVPVGSIASCQGASAGLFDMIGNLREWQADCAAANCTLRGGGFSDVPSATDDHDIVHCRAQAFAAPKADRYAQQGFRCCADVR